eukprot:UN22456
MNLIFKRLKKHKFIFKSFLFLSPVVGESSPPHGQWKPRSPIIFGRTTRQT